MAKGIWGWSSLKVAVALSLSFSVYQISSVPSASSLAITWSPHRSADNLLCVLGSREQTCRVNASEVREFQSCLKFLVPFSPSSVSNVSPKISLRRRLLFGKDQQSRRMSENRLIWWPPRSVLNLAHRCVDSGGDPDSIHTALGPVIFPIPDVEGCKQHKCSLSRTPFGRRFIDMDLNAYLAFLFELIMARGPSVGLNVSLSRYDLFHGHLFIARESRRVGILFHAREYLAYDSKSFPYHLGYCQTGSSLKYDYSINLRNILWLAPLPSAIGKGWLAPGVLVVLDAHPEGIIYQNLVLDDVDLVRTIYEDEFGEAVADVNYFDLQNVNLEDKIFIC